MLRIALLMLFRDRAKYVMLVVGLTFCSLLMTQQASVFCGLMLWTTATVRNIGAKVWVFDAKVEQANEVIPLREIEVTRVRGIPGVEWAVPIYLGIEQARLGDGSFQNVQLTGLDTATFVGRPMEITKGRIEDLRLPDAVIIDQVGIDKFRKGDQDRHRHHLRDQRQARPGGRPLPRQPQLSRAALRLHDL